MPPPPRSSGPVVLVCGDDDFAVRQRARQIYQQWCAEAGGMDHQTIDAQVTHSGDALKALARLREALQTLPFFGSAKVIWLQNCTFLGDERGPASRDLTDALTELAQQLKDLRWDNVRLLISAGKADKPKVLLKTIEQLGALETFNAWSLNDKDWASEAQSWALRGLRARKKEITHDALVELVQTVGPHRQQLASEVEKLSLYVGARPDVTVQDVRAVVTRNKDARAFALADALGARDLPGLLRTLDHELWELRLDRQRSAIGLLFGLISKMRGLILLQELIREGWIDPELDKDRSGYARFKAQLERVPAEKLPEDRRFNPLALNAYMLFKALPHVRRYSQAELLRAMSLLLECNWRLVSSDLDDALVLQQTLVEIVRGPAPSGPREPPAR